MSLYRAPSPSAWNPTVSMPARSSAWQPVKKNTSPRMYSDRNMRAASPCVNEFVSRPFPFRLESNRLYARTQFSLAACEEEHFSEDVFRSQYARGVALRE